MATTRQRRAKPALPAQDLHEEDRVYTEEDYAVPAQAIADEWDDAQEIYPSAGWTGENFMPDEAFAPDEEEALPEPSWADNYPGAEDDYPSGYPNAFDFSDDIDPLSEDLLTEEEQAALKRSHWKLIAGLADFAGVIVGTAAILILITLLISLINWLVNDMSQSFILLQKHF